MCGFFFFFAIISLWRLCFDLCHYLMDNKVFFEFTRNNVNECENKLLAYIKAI